MAEYFRRAATAPRPVVVLSATAGSTEPSRFLNRELSWLDFSSRLLDLAADEKEALFERVKFLAIFASGLDEFFQVRVAGLKDQIAASVRSTSPDGMTPAEQLIAIRVRTLELVERHSAIFATGIQPELEKNGIHLTDFAALDAEAKDELREIFERDLYPVLTPLSVDPGHPFPYISNLSLSLAVRVEDKQTKEARFARVKVPPLLPRFVQLADGVRLVPLEQVISSNLGTLFPDMLIGARHCFRVTRNAEIDFEETDAEDLLEAIELELRRRRFGKAVRLEIDPNIGPEPKRLLLEELELSDADVYAPRAPLDLAQLWSIVGKDRPELKDRPWVPIIPPRMNVGGQVDEDIFSVIRRHDVLLHHPYESFGNSVEAFIAQAAADPDVLAIKQTLYRTSGDAQFVTSLAQAAEAGKQVAALVELTARFDEQRNIAWARQLEEAGVHVVYGVVGLKTHAKTILVVRREPDGIRCYCHIGTGNYNSDTARSYEDLGLLTCDPAIGSDLTNLFNHLTGFSRPVTTKALVLAPNSFRPWVLARIATEAAAGEGGRIAFKVNGITDPEVIDALYQASQAGCRIELIVRGLCSLRPGVPGLSETITVRSIVGRFLEHSRIYRFGAPSDEVRTLTLFGASPDPDATNPAEYFIGSGDLLQRNLDFRIEALTPVIDPSLCARLQDSFDVAFADDRFAWMLDADGNWSRVPTKRGISSQGVHIEFAQERNRHHRQQEQAI
jgi:polyphosphate kinase